MREAEKRHKHTMMTLEAEKGRRMCGDEDADKSIQGDIPWPYKCELI